jgi:hypothetical protein
MVDLAGSEDDPGRQQHAAPRQGLLRAVGYAVKGVRALASYTCIALHALRSERARRFCYAAALV